MNNIQQIKERIYKYYKPNELWKDEDIINSKEKEFDISLIVPVYNTEKYLEKCIDTIIHQKTHYRYEVIIINDGSTDNCKNILEKYKNKSNIKIITRENQGASATRNYGINCSKGEYISFIDSDDYISEDYIEMLMDTAIKENCDFVKCGYYEFDDNKKDIIKYQDIIIEGKDKKEDLLKVQGHPWGCVIKRKIFDNIRFPVGYWYEDMIMRFLVMPKCNKIHVIDKCLYFYRINYNGLSKKENKQVNYKCLDQYFLLEKIIEKREEMKLTIDIFIFKAIIHELGALLWLRTRWLNKETQTDVFLLASNLINKFYISDLYCNLDKQEKYIVNCLVKKKYYSWKILSIWKMIKIKYKINII